MKITDFMVMDSDGKLIPADPFGNNLAFACQTCGHPVLAVSLEHQRGSSKDKPAICRNCGTAYYLDVRSKMEKIYVHQAAAH